LRLSQTEKLSTKAHILDHYARNDISKRGELSPIDTEPRQQRPLCHCEEVVAIIEPSSAMCESANYHRTYTPPHPKIYPFR
ncbi:MAG: hypothetical protein O2974_04085, partial [Chloroflexi bacterium]|nr:hypothetical protein [Chloroflexota bacterium]